jgi:hypothetical protein
MERIENRTFDELELGDTANLVRTLTYKDIEVFAIMSGDVNPNAPHPIPPKVANVPVLAVYPDNRQNAAKVRAHVDVFARRLC